MRRIGGFCFVLASLVATPTVVHAQWCGGTASFADGNLRAAVGTSSAPEWRSYGVALSVGRARGVFASGGVSRGKYDHSDVTDLAFSGSVGYQVRLGARVQLCPKLNASHTDMTYNFGRTHVDYGSNTMGISSALGAAVWSSRRFALVPSAELGYAVTSAHVQQATGGIEHEAQASRRSGALSLSSGLIFGKVVTVSPFVSIPLGVRGVGNVYGGSIAISFGPR